MRFYHLPPGHAGRPRELLPYADRTEVLTALTVVGVLLGAGLGGLLIWRGLRDRKTTMVGLIGLDLFATR